MWLRMVNRIVNLDNVNELSIEEIQSDKRIRYYIRCIYVGQNKTWRLLEVHSRKNAQLILDGINKFIGENEPVENLLGVFKTEREENND